MMPFEKEISDPAHFRTKTSGRPEDRDSATLPAWPSALTEGAEAPSLRQPLGLTPVPCKGGPPPRTGAQGHFGVAVCILRLEVLEPQSQGPPHPSNVHRKLSIPCCKYNSGKKKSSDQKGSHFPRQLLPTCFSSSEKNGKEAPSFCDGPRDGFLGLWDLSPLSFS